MNRYKILIIVLIFFGLIYVLSSYVNPQSKINIFKGFSSGSNNIDTNPNAINSGADVVSTSTNGLINVATSTGGNSVNRGNLPPVYGGNNGADLTDDGVFIYTNIERKQMGLSPLKRNGVLDSAATIKLTDMFANQYFEHMSPTGAGVSDVVNGVKYDFLVVGENLALGNFGGDYQVVQAWMNSPGHKANILDKRYTEIGIAVGYGFYNGKKQWIAVQHFARPMSSCASPSISVKNKISALESELSGIEKDIVKLKLSLDKTEATDPSFVSAVSAYNAIVTDYNNKLKILKSNIEIYNDGVKTFNACLDTFTKSSH